MKKVKLKLEPSLIPKLDAFKYQKIAYEAIKDLEYSAIFHEQGLGKTKIAIDLLLYWLEEKDIDTVMVVTKKQLVQNWRNEFSRHTYLKPTILTNNRDNNFFVFNGPSRVIITNFETIVSEKDRFHLYLESRNVAIIVDESAKLKNPESKLTQSFFELSGKFKIRTIMTGTPVANRPYDIWAQIFFLDKGKSLGKDFEKFKRETDLSNNLFENKERQKSFEENISKVFGQIEEFSVRETKNSGIISLPDKKIENIFVKFEKDQLLLYNKVREDMIVLVKREGEQILDDSTAILKRLLRLVQVASNPKLVDERYDIISGKEQILDELITKIVQSNEKCIVWSNFIDNINYFTKKYSYLGSTKIHGKMKISERNASVQKFSSEEYKILFATPASAKEGLTLTMANHVIFYDRGFSLDDYLQAQDRIHRISQKKTCFVHNLIIKDSIDEWVDLLLDAKQNAAFLVQGDIGKDQYREKADYSFGDMVKDILKIGNNNKGELN